MRQSEVSAQFWAIIICTILGFIIGGIYGMIAVAGFHPTCWWGALIGFAVAIGAPICLHALD